MKGIKLGGVVKKISICIPTYNRSQKLDATLLNLKKILKEKLKIMIEVVISDNASTDNTEEVVLKYKKDFEIIYQKNSENKKFDYNLENASRMATGEYIWFCGDDDIIREGALEKILEKLEKRNDIYILNGSIDDKKRNGLNLKDSKVFFTVNENEYIEYIESINYDLSFFLAFITSIVVKRERYRSIIMEEKIKGSSYDHLYKCLKILKEGCKLEYLSEDYYNAGENENEWNAERGKHSLLDLTSYYTFINNLYDENAINLRKSIGRLLNRNYGKVNLIYNYYYAKNQMKEKEFKIMMNYFYMNSFKNSFFIKFLSNRITIYIIDKLLNIYRKIKRSGGKNA